MDRHINERIALRVNDAQVRAMIERRCDAFAKTVRNSRKDFAVRVVRLNERQGTLDFNADGTGTSNGDCGVMIVRQGKPVTFMWRRSDQPHTSAALRVQVATCFKDVCDHASHR